MNCEICGKEAKTLPGLVKHLTGTKPYGCHEISREKALEIARKSAESDAELGPEIERVDSIPPATVSDLPKDRQELFLVRMLDSMINDKRLPKYQFERVIGPMIGLFLPDILAARYGGTYELVTVEFPLKKSGSFQTTNMDYVVHRTDPSPGDWVFVELKTDVGSFRGGQDTAYKGIQGRRMSELIEEVRAVSARSSQQEKYEALLERFQGIATDGTVSIVYLAPEEPDKRRTLETAGIDFISFAELENLKVSDYAVEWELFAKHVLPALT